MDQVRADTAIVNHTHDDYAAKMLSALMMDDYEPQPMQSERVSVGEQKRYLMRWIDTLTTEEKKSIGRICIMNNMRGALKPCADGTVINLDTLPPEIIQLMYDFIVCKRKK